MMGIQTGAEVVGEAEDGDIVVSFQHFLFFFLWGGNPLDLTPFFFYFFGGTMLCNVN